MDITQAKNIINKEYEPFHPIHNRTVKVYGCYLRDIMDEEESIIRRNRIVIFDLYTIPQLMYISENCMKNDFVLAHSTFTAKLPLKDEWTLDKFEGLFDDDKFHGFIITNDQLQLRNYNTSGVLGLSLQGTLETTFLNDEENPPYENIYLIYDRNRTNRQNEKDKALIQSFQHYCNIESDGLPPRKSIASKIPADESLDIEVRIYKVGAANTTYVIYEGNGTRKSLLIDCGINRLSQQEKNRIEAHTKTDLKPNGIIVSHWHSDHYNLLLDKSVNLDDLEFIIIPGKTKKGKTYSIRSEIQNIKQKKGVKIISLDNGFQADILNNLGFPMTYLYKGNGNPTKTPKSPNYGAPHKTDGTEYYDNDNETAIMVKIVNNNKNIILPSDVSYYFWPNDLKIESGNYILTPHHGGGVYFEAIPDADKNIINNLSIFTSSIYSCLKYSDNPSHKDYIDELTDDSLDDNYTANIVNDYYYSFKI